MKASRRGQIIWVVLVIFVAGSAYLLGYRSNGVQPESVATATKSVQKAPSAAVLAANSPAPGTPARQLEWEQLKAILENPDHSGMLQALIKLQNQLAQTDPDALQFFLEQMASLAPGYGRDLGIQRLVIQLLSYRPPKDLPADTFSLLGLISDPGVHSDVTNRVFNSIAKSDPHLAMDELAQLPPGSPTEKIFRNVFSAMAGANSTDGLAAATAALALPAGADRAQAMSGAMEGWISGDKGHPDLSIAQAALNWASSLPPSADSAALLKAAMIATTDASPALAAQYIDSLTDTAVRNSTIQSIVRTWATPGINNFPGTPSQLKHQDPAAALDWLGQVSTGDTYGTNVKYIFSRLDPASASTLIDKVNDPSLRETVIATVANAWSGRDPQATLTWLQTLPDSDGQTRNLLVQQITQSAGRSTGP